MAKSIVADHIKNLTPYPPGKPLSELKRELGLSDAIKMASNENPWGPSKKAIEAMTDALSEVQLYPDGGGFYLRRLLAERLDLAPEQFMFGNGSNDLIDLLVRTFGGPEHGIVTSESTFVVYRLIAQATGVPFTEVAMPPDTLTFDLDAIAEQVTDNTRFVFLCNPNNPTGTMFDAEQLDAFLDRIGPEPIVVLDEAYIEYVDPEKRVDSLAVMSRRKRTVILRTFSKAYGLAGIRIGYGITSPDLVSYVERVRQPFNTNHIAQVGAIAALQDEEHLQTVVEGNREGVRVLTAGLKELGLRPIATETNFVLFELGQDGRPIYDELLKLGVIIRPMNAYKLPNYLRVSVGLPHENDRFLKALAQVLS